jgi:murein DD-endopeptidase MepM/ murein hydrolase activator NlpD
MQGMNILHTIRKYKNKRFEVRSWGAKLVIMLALFLLPLINFAPTTVVASTSQIDQLDAQIRTLNSQISAKSKEKQSLQGQVSLIDSQIYAIQLQINATQLKIDKSNADITATNANIAKAEAELKVSREQLSEIIRAMYENGQLSNMEIMVKSNNFSDFVNRSEYMETMQLKVQSIADKILIAKKEMEAKKAELEKQKKEMETLKKDQLAQRYGVDTQRAERNSILTSTKGQESAFQSQLSATQKARDAAWANYWNSLNGPKTGGSSYGGGAGSGYLIWPSSNGVLTQGYGWTTWANQGVYNGQIHNGIDIGHPWSLPRANILAAASGYVLSRGSDSGWGNWVLIKHPNGLVTLYGHMSSVYVSTGQSVSQGQTIGIEGSTGFSSGDHLHFSVYTNISLYYNSFSYSGTASPYSFF